MKSAFSYLPHWPLVPDTVFWVGLTLLMAGLCGELCWKAWRLPRITGYGVIGLLAGSAGFGVIDNALANDARFLMDVALGMLLFELGNRLNLRWIRTNPWLIATSLAEATLTFATVIIALQLMDVPLMTTTVIASIAIATSPTMVIQLKTELKSEGQVTERLLALTALNSMYAVILLELVSTWMHQEYYGNLFATLTEPLYLILGSLAIAYVLARSCQRVNLHDEHSFVILIGLVLLAIAVTHMLELSTLLALLTAGIILKNFDPRPQLWQAHFGTAGWLLTVVLFVITLISFQWTYLALGGFAALAMIGARMLAKLLGVLAFAKPSGISMKQGLALGLTLAPMSAFAYLLVENTYTLYPNFDPNLRAIMLSAILILQLFTPLLVYWSLSFIGERRQ